MTVDSYPVPFFVKMADDGKEVFRRSRNRFICSRVSCASVDVYKWGFIVDFVKKKGGSHGGRRGEKNAIRFLENI